MPSLSLRRPPGPLVAYLPDTDPEALAEHLVAFANADGGTVIIGMKPSGKIVNRIFADELEHAVKAAERLCRPPIVTGWEQVEAERGVTYAITVPRSPELHSLADGRVLIRAGDQNRPLGGEEIRQLAATKSAGDFEAEAAPGTKWEDLDGEVVAEYLEKRQQRQRRASAHSPLELLHEIGAVDERGRPTHSGLLLFGRNPQQFLPQSGLVFVKFPGTEPRGEDGLAGYGRREEIGGPLARIIEAAWQIVWEEMNVGAVVKGLEREELPDYPPFAVREALVNAVAHRDYRLKGRRIEIRMYADRLEVISPGGLPGFITVDNIVEEHFSRNPRMVAGLFQWGYIEELGLGIDRMIEEMLAQGHPAPRFRAAPYAFTVTLSNARERKAVPRWENIMNERQARAITYLREQGHITNREYRQLCPDVSPETLRLDLADLVHRGVIIKVGANKGTYYILK